MMGLVGGGCPSKVEPNRALSVSRLRGVSWARNTLDLAELARLRWEERVKNGEIAYRMGVSRSTVMRGLRKLRATKLAR